MKKMIITLALAMAFWSAHSQSFEGKGDSKINLGYEFYGIGSGIKGSFDLGLNKLFSIGAGGTYYINNDDQDYFLYARTNVHLGIVCDLPSALDIYPGVEIGLLSSSELGFTGYVGVRYCVSKRISLFAELGNHGAAGISIDV